VSDHALNDDPLRILRGYRLWSEHGLEPDCLTALSFRTQGHKVATAAPERIHDEWMRLLVGPDVGIVLRTMQRYDFFDVLFPELGPCHDMEQGGYHHLPVYEHQCMAMRHCWELQQIYHVELLEHMVPLIIPTIEDLHQRALLMTALLLHDIGKPETRSVDEQGNIHFYGHEQRSAELARVALNRLRFSHEEITYITQVITNHLQPLWLMDQSAPERRLARICDKLHPYLVPTLLHAICDQYAAQGPRYHPAQRLVLQALSCAILEHWEQVYLPQQQAPLLTGKVLLTQGYTAGPQLGVILRDVRQQQLDGTLTNHADALDYVVQKYPQTPLTSQV
jgi:tRNA nucleotidyltransferase/poly(A) polymerase